jgi:hypothetical protein
VLFCRLSRSKEHTAGFSKEMVEICIVAGCPAGSSLINGSGTTGVVAKRMGRPFIVVRVPKVVPNSGILRAGFVTAAVHWQRGYSGQMDVVDWRR